MRGREPGDGGVAGRGGLRPAPRPARGPGVASRGAPAPGCPAPVRRDVVDHALARRALLQQVFGGGLWTTLSLDDVCDASPYLLRAAQVYGEQTGRTCPLCRRDRLWEVAWVYGDAIGPVSGSARSPAQLARLAAERPDFAVHEVEVCVRCRWNHLLRSWRTGTPGAPRARRGRDDEPG